MKRSIPSLLCITFVAVLFLAGCDTTSTQDAVDPGAGKPSDGSLPISLVGTWLRIDSNYVVSSAGDTTYDGTDDGYLNHDTVYAYFAADGRYAGIEILWSKDERSAGYQQHTVDTISGNWSVSGGVLTRTYMKHGVSETGVHAFTTGGTSLVLVSGKSGRKFSFKRISETANLPVAGKSPGTEPSSTTTGVGLTFSPASGAYTSAQSVTIKGSVPGSSIYYTTNGSVPTTSSTPYTEPIKLSSPTSTGGTIGTTIRAVEVDKGNSVAAGVSWYSVRLDGAVVLAPVVTPSLGGSFSGPVSISVRAQLGDTLYCSDNGSTMSSCAGGTNQKDLTIESSGPFMALSKRGIGSPVVTGYFHIDGTIDQPSIQTSITDSGSLVAMTDSVAGAEIRYSLDGSNPTSASTLYTSPFFVESGKTVKAVAFHGGKSSSVAQRPITVMVSTPVFTPAPGTYARPQVVSITTSTAGASLRYTIDGTTPTPNSELYTGSITVASSATIKVLATKQGLSSRSSSATYVITSLGP